MMKLCRTSGSPKISCRDSGKSVYNSSGCASGDSFFTSFLGPEVRCFLKDCYEVEKHILCALAIGFGLPDDYFVQVHTKPDNQLRLLHYPR
jgi:isopenicillin N synthase-like dioxygenase